MNLLDRFKTKKPNPKKGQKTENVLDMVQDAPADNSELSREAGSGSARKENTGLAHQILKHHHLSEKTNAFAAKGRYVFKVATNTNKIEVKKAIEKVYDVHVTKVNILNVLGKNRRQGKSRGRTQDWKKAIITLRDGERIAGLSEGV